MRTAASSSSRPLLLATAFLVVACSVGDKADKAAKVSFSGDSASAMVLGPGDVRITSTDGALVLAVVGDSVRMQLSDSLRNHVKKEIDSSAAGDSKLAASIIKGVSGIVNSAVGFVVRVHVKDVQNLRYEDGKLRFDVRGDHVNLHTSDKSTANNATFSADDAQRFIDAVKRRQEGAIAQ